MGADGVVATARADELDPGDRGRRGRRPLMSVLGILAAGLMLGLAVLLSAVLQGDVPDAVGDRAHLVQQLLQRQGHLTAFGLLYVEESGIPLLAPGDVFVMYVGAHVSHTLTSLLAAWLGLILAVVLGASNLYLVSRRLGRGVAETRVARLVHLTPERLIRAEAWFSRYGVLAIIFGRHIPGFRVPITVAAGVFRVPYPLFAVSVAISTAIWAGVFLTIGVLYGGRVEAFLRLHRETYWLLAVGIAVVVGTYFLSHIRSLHRSKPGPAPQPAP